VRHFARYHSAQLSIYKSDTTPSRPPVVIHLSILSVMSKPCGDDCRGSNNQDSVATDSIILDALASQEFGPEIRTMIPLENGRQPVEPCDPTEANAGRYGESQHTNTLAGDIPSNALVSGCAGKGCCGGEAAITTQQEIGHVEQIVQGHGDGCQSRKSSANEADRDEGCCDGRDGSNKTEDKAASCTKDTSTVVPSEAPSEAGTTSRESRKPSQCPSKVTKPTGCTDRTPFNSAISVHATAATPQAECWSSSVQTDPAVSTQSRDSWIPEAEGCCSKPPQVSGQGDKLGSPQFGKGRCTPKIEACSASNTVPVSIGAQPIGCCSSGAAGTGSIASQAIDNGRSSSGIRQRRSASINTPAEETSSERVQSARKGESPIFGSLRKDVADRYRGPTRVHVQLLC